MEEKRTKKEMFDHIKTVIEGVDCADKGEMIDFLQEQMNLIDKRSEKAKERAAKKRQESDKLKEEVRKVLTDKLVPIDEIVSKLDGDADITKAKVIARLSQLVKEGYAFKESVKTESGRKVMAYAIIAPMEDEEEVADTDTELAVE